MQMEEYKHQVNAVWRATVILGAVTSIEVASALLYNQLFFDSGYRMALNVFMIIATLVKAFYIVSVFMHLRYERKALALTVLMPLGFLIWFIIAFMWEGISWHAMRGF